MHNIYDTSIMVLNNGHAKVIKYLYPRTIEDSPSRSGVVSNVIRSYSSPEELASSSDTKKDRVKKSSSEIRKISAFRALKNIKLRAEHNYKRFNSCITLTFAPSRCNFDVTNVFECNARLNSYLTNLRQVNGDVDYIGVPEYQKNGDIHYHILCSLPLDCPSLPRRRYKVVKSKGKFKTMYYYDLPGWSFGWSYADSIDSTSKALNYITKYVTKDCVNSELPAGAHRFYSSHSLDRPLIVDVLCDECDNFSFFDGLECSKSYCSKNEEWNIMTYNIYFSPDDVDNGSLSLTDIINRFKKDGLYCRQRVYC